MELLKRYRVQAAHHLPSAGPDDPEHRLHGHTYSVEIHVRGPVDPVAGWVMDYGDITAATKPLFDQLDHHLLNDIEGLADPTAAAVARWIYDRLVTTLSLLHRVVVIESKTLRGTYPGEESS